VTEQPLRIGIAGLGVVGGGVVTTLQQNAGLIASRIEREIQIVAVSARNKSRHRHLPLGDATWCDRAVDLANHPDVDVVVELIGGSEGVARELCETALKNGKHVVTANKALIAHHGVELAQLAESQRRVLAFEAAVAGGIPIVKAFREALGANRFHRVAGILNGTCNYILSAMQHRHQDFETVLAEAQRLGYAEADPSFDVDGIDTAHKLAILTSLAYGSAVDIEGVHIEGIRSIALQDIIFADQLGYVIKLLGIARETEQGIEQRVHPCMVPSHSALAAVEDAFNAVEVEGDATGKMIFEGRGAGAGPTASAVIADIMDIARGSWYRPFNLPADKLQKRNRAAMDDLEVACYLRLSVIDRPGVLAEITSIFRDEQISLHSCLQRARMPGSVVQVVLTTHETRESALQRAVKRIGALDAMTDSPRLIRIENL
jgi:homoserine dehydrogenase